LIIVVPVDSPCEENHELATIVLKELLMLRRLLFALPLLAVAGAAPAHAQCDTRFDFFNRSSRTVMEFYFDSSRNPNWTRDELGTGVLPRGQGRRFQAAHTGNYDFRVVFDNGRAVELRQINICTTSRVTVTDSGLRAE
jgi:hypothetical protein